MTGPSGQYCVVGDGSLGYPKLLDPVDVSLSKAQLLHGSWPFLWFFREFTHLKSGVVIFSWWESLLQNTDFGVTFRSVCLALLMSEKTCKVRVPVLPMVLWCDNLSCRTISSEQMKIQSDLTSSSGWFLRELCLRTSTPYLYTMYMCLCMSMRCPQKETQKCKHKSNNRFGLHGY